MPDDSVVRVLWFTPGTGVRKPDHEIICGRELADEIASHTTRSVIYIRQADGKLAYALLPDEMYADMINLLAGRGATIAWECIDTAPAREQSYA